MSGTAVVLLHALSQDASMWDGPRAALAAKGYQVLAPDQRGFGAAPLGGPPATLDVVADDVARLLDERGFVDAVLVGSSMGGYVAMSFLRRHPGRVRALGLLAARATSDDPAARAERETFARLVVDPVTGPVLVEALVPKLVGATTRALRPDVLAQVRKAALSADKAALAWAQRAIAARPDSRDVLSTSGVPTLVIAGDEDELVPVDTAAGARLVVVPGAGHLLPLEAPEQVVTALAGLLDEAGVLPC
jgi:pimeloyl-ACP methyl ester carboxylesterase